MTRFTACEEDNPLTAAGRPNGSEEPLDPESVLNRYATRLISLARTRISTRLRRRLDAEDVVQSAMGSFFRRANDGAYELSSDDDLWPLLATITINKLRKRIDFHTAAKRSLNCEESLCAGSSWIRFEPASLAHDPDHDDEVLLEEELNATLQILPALHRDIVAMSLCGHSVADVAQETQRTERTVRRALERFRMLLHARLAD